ncbi:RES domain-containing protein [Vreelandella songnenensis]|uniref:RES domain-containing protein n=1 Tax=Vreelandella songnenensis TaxID=1176243 RepID=A0A2T0V2N3_9GAMM|nr:RES domain-containing protein [Halomonas songnenensis]PRY64432.1 RES domain-containing protein [Halomonas songnenensis]
MYDKETNTLKLVDVDFLEKFRQELFNSSDPQFVEEKLKWFLSFYEPINTSLSYNQLHWRARKCSNKDGFSFVHELLAPPADLVRPGRMNEANDPMLYLSGAANTALSEIEAQPGDFVHMIGISELSNPSLLMVGEIVNAYHGNALFNYSITKDVKKVINDMPPRVMKSFVYMDALASEIFRDKNASISNYLYSRILYKLLKGRYPSLDGIVYPSVAHEGSANIALKPNIFFNKFSIEVCIVVKVVARYSYGFFDMDVIRKATSNDSNGLIVWSV